MAVLPGEPRVGLRERKKQRTRATLIDVAMELCLRQGYEQTTVDQIAEAADVSPRTFSRYFATKESVFLTLIEDFVDRVSVELAAVPPEVGPLEALRAAHVDTLSRVVNQTGGDLTSDRIVLMLKVFNASPALRQAAFEFRHPTSTAILARRMGVEVGDRRHALVAAIFSAVMVTACGDLIDDTDVVRLGPEVMIARINDAFDQLATVVGDLSVAHLPADLEVAGPALETV